MLAVVPAARRTLKKHTGQSLRPGLKLRQMATHGPRNVGLFGTTYIQLNDPTLGRNRYSLCIVASSRHRRRLATGLPLLAYEIGVVLARHKILDTLSFSCRRLWPRRGRKLAVKGRLLYFKCKLVKLKLHDLYVASDLKILFRDPDV